MFFKINKFVGNVRKIDLRSTIWSPMDWLPVSVNGLFTLSLSTKIDFMACYENISLWLSNCYGAGVALWLRPTEK